MRTAALVIFLISLTNVSACNIPVFRYALERWQPDRSQIFVFHKTSLNERDKTFVDQLQKSSANVDVTVHDVTTALSDNVAGVWGSFQSDAELPFLVVRSPAGIRKKAFAWTGSVADAAATGLVTSPARRELGRRLSTGHSVVWIVLKSADSAKNNAVLDLLNSELPSLADKVPLPEGIGLPGSELHSDVPLLMKFSTLEVAHDDPKEEMLTSLFRGLATDTDDPLVIPVFGRGRALEVIPSSTLDAQLMEDLTLFLSGACSCQVKERNPGFDLLLQVDWQKHLFGDDGTDIARPIAESPEAKKPVLLTIPPGSANRRRGDDSGREK